MLTNGDRVTNDRFITLGTDVEGAVRRLSTTYEIWGIPTKLVSYDNAPSVRGASSMKFP